MRPTVDFPSPPVHGYRGNPEPQPLVQPQGLSVAISREAGARGSTIARKVAELLGWQVFDQDSLDYLMQNDAAREQLLADLPPPATAWASIQFARFELDAKADPDTAAMLRLLLAVAARGDAVIVGRGAGYLLPAETTLHVRIVAPREARIAYFAQWLRLTRDEAEEEVRVRDGQRTEYLQSILGRNPTDAIGYDIVVNAGRLGVEAAAQFIGWAVRTKQNVAELRHSEELPNKDLAGP